MMPTPPPDGARIAALAVLAAPGLPQCEVTYLLAGDSAPGDGFGHALAVSAGNAIVGAPRDDDAGLDAGAAYVFRRGLDGRWNQVQKLVPAGLSAGDEFGVSVSIAGGVAVIGAHLDDERGTDAGAAYVYELGPCL